MCQIGVGGCTTLQNAIDFLLKLLMLLWMLAEQVPGPRKSSGSCFMASRKEDQAFGHHLLITHGLSIFIFGLQEDGEEVIALAWMATPLFNEVFNVIAQHLRSFVGPAIERCGPIVWGKP